MSELLASDTLIAVASITESVIGNIKLPGSANTVEVKNQLAYGASVVMDQMTCSLDSLTRTFGPPIVIPVPGSTSLRGLNVLDMNQDDLVDVIAIAEDGDNQRRLLVFPRTSATTFGTPIESEIITRDLILAVGTVDFVSSGTDLLVLGDDRVRVYSPD